MQKAHIKATCKNCGKIDRNCPKTVEVAAIFLAYVSDLESECKECAAKGRICFEICLEF